MQESLTNTRKHGGLAATAAVTLRYEPDGLTVEVIDDGIASPGNEPAGHGLAGMRERIAMYGGTVQAGPLQGGGFGVTAHLPCPSARGADRGASQDQPEPTEPVASRPGQQQDGYQPDQAGNGISLGWSGSSGLSGAAR